MNGSNGLEGKTVMITGATSGLGREAALALAELGPRLYLVCRDPNRAKEIAAEIVRSSGNDDVRILLADLSSLRQIDKSSTSFWPPVTTCMSS
jgi:NAD(P)-dependent dehydrogenase (short-subunit alcohol dehydrogenase family)